MTARVPAYEARNKTIGSLGMTADLNEDSRQIASITTALNQAPPIAASWYSVTSPNYEAGRTTLLGLDTLAFLLHTRIVVEFGPNGEYQETWKLIYDAAGDRQALREHGGPLLPVSWVRVSDKRSGVPSYDELQVNAPAGGFVFKLTDLIRDYAGGGVELFFAPLVEGALPRPSDPDGDANWRKAGDEEVAEPEPFDVVFTLSQAQSAAVAGQVKINRQYRIRGGDVPTGRDILTHGMSRYGYEPQAYRALANPSTGRETYEVGTYVVATGVFTPAVDIAAELALKAPLASPIFVDFPRAPTPAIDSNISGELLATIDFVRRSFSDTTAFLARKPTGQVANNVSSLNAAYSFAANGLVILNRPVKSGFVFTGSATLDCQGYSINFDGADINAYDGAKIINNKLLLKARLFCRPSPNAIITIEGGVFSGQIYFFEQSATVIFDGCDVVDFGAGIGSGGFCSTPGGKIILRNGAQLLQPADPSTVVEVEPPATVTPGEQDTDIIRLSKYNFKTTNTAAQNGAAFQQAILDAQAGPRRLQLPAGSFESTGVTIPLDSPILIFGAGGEDTYLQHCGTLLTTNSPTADLITVTQPGNHFSLFGVRNNASDVTAGSGIKIDIRGTHPTANQFFPNGVGSNFSMFGVTTNGFYINTNIVNGFEWNITNCTSQNSKLAGLKIASEQLPDGGDGHISGCQFLAGKYTDGHGILNTSSGGTGITNCKFNSGRHPNNGKFFNCYTYRLDNTNAPPGILAHTSVLKASNNSYENFTGRVFDLDGLDLVTISSSEVGPYGGTVGNLFRFKNCNRGSLLGIVATNADSPIRTRLADFVSCDKWVVGPNVDFDFGGNPSQCYGQDDCTDIRIIGTDGAPSPAPLANPPMPTPTLPGAPTPPAPGFSPSNAYASFAGTNPNEGNFMSPAVAGTLAVSMWVRATAAANASDPKFLLDLRPTPAAYLYGADNFTGFGEVWANGVQVADRASLSAFITGGWVKVYAEISGGTDGAIAWISRFVAAGNGSYFAIVGDVADAAIYSRLWTAAEKADATGQAPADAAARYDFRNITGTTLPDASGNGHTANLRGQAPVFKTF